MKTKKNKLSRYETWMLMLGILYEHQGEMDYKEFIQAIPDFVVLSNALDPAISFIEKMSFVSFNLLPNYDKTIKLLSEGYSALFNYEKAKTIQAKVELFI